MQDFIAQVASRIEWFVFILPNNFLYLYYFFFFFFFGGGGGAEGGKRIIKLQVVLIFDTFLDSDFFRKVTDNGV